MVAYKKDLGDSWTQSKSLLLSRVVLMVFLCMLIAGSFGLPWILRWYVNYSGNSNMPYIPVMLCLWTCAVPAFVALLRLRCILNNIADGNVFVADNVLSLRIISWCCFLVAVILCVYFFYYVFGVILAILAAFMGLILRVVKNVFVQALAIKEENDFTV